MKNTDVLMDLFKTQSINYVIDVKKIADFAKEILKIALHVSGTGNLIQFLLHLNKVNAKKTNVLKHGIEMK